MQRFTAARPCGAGWAMAAGAAVLLAAAGGATAQEQRQHINPVIAKLAAGEPFIGVSTGDLSLSNANELTRAPIDGGLKRSSQQPDQGGCDDHREAALGPIHA
jgi:hypothetical protein